MTSIYANPSHTANIMAFCAPELKAEYLTESLLEVLNNREKVNALESSRSTYTNFEYEVGRKYIKIWSYLIVGSEERPQRACWMFVDKNTGEVYKPASYKAPAKGVRYLITQLVNNPETCDPYGSFLYL